MLSRLAAFLATSLLLFLAAAGVSRLYGALLRAPWSRLAPPVPKARPMRAMIMPPEPHAERAGGSRVYDDAFLEPVFPPKKAETPEPVQAAALEEAAAQEPAPEEEPEPKPVPEPAARKTLNKISLDGAAGYPMKRFIPAVMGGTEPGPGAAPQAQGQVRQPQAQQLQPMQAAEHEREASPPPAASAAPAKRALTSITRPIGGLAQPVHQQQLPPEIAQPSEPAAETQGE